MSIFILQPTLTPLQWFVFFCANLPVQMKLLIHKSIRICGCYCKGKCIEEQVDPFLALFQLGPNVSIGTGVTIGAGVRVRESIILHGATLQVSPVK